MQDSARSIIRLSGKYCIRSALATLILVGTQSATASGNDSNQRADDLAEQFLSPPADARPHVWWHWLNGNITKDGIEKDLQWMSRIGIGGLQNFDASLNTPQIVDKRLVYMTPEWKDAFRYAAQRSEELNLDLAIAASPGWSETGGPWVTPQDGMKKLVWSEIDIQGGKRFVGTLPAPPSVSGPFQDIRLAHRFGETERPDPVHYNDVAVLAYPLLQKKVALPLPTMTTQLGVILDVGILQDGKYAQSISVEKSAAGTTTFVDAKFASPQTIRSVSVSVQGLTRSVTSPPAMAARLDAISTEKKWEKVADISFEGAEQTTISFEPVTSEHFRLIFVPVTPQTTAARVGYVNGARTDQYRAPQPAKPDLELAEFRLSQEGRVDRFEVKAGFGVVRDYFDITNGPPSDLKVPLPTDVIDLTGKIGSNGELSWTPPAGQWRILRIGTSLIGTTNHPATLEATGLEVDKLDGAAVTRYLNTYLDMYEAATGPELIGKRGLKGLLTDSIEAGAANWTPRFMSQFKRLRGYDPLPWLPVITGAVIGSRKQSDGFLYDYRRTLADLIATEHYKTIATVAHDRGLKVYSEALELGRPSLGDDMAMRSHADIPMAAFWTRPANGGDRPVFLADMKGAASVAHIYGKNHVAAESLTSGFAPWAYSPADLKPFIDLEFVYGITRPIIHTSVHQPVDDKKPGLSLLIFGQYFNRHETWAEMASPWVDYMARSSVLLTQGRYQADVAYFYGEEAPLTGLYKDRPVQDAPTHYGYDFVNADIVATELRVDNGNLVTNGGAQYRVLYLGGSSRQMTGEMLRRIALLAEQGATIIGMAPEKSPGLVEDENEYKMLLRRLWSGSERTKVGRGQVIASRDVETVLRSLGLDQDFAITGNPKADILFLHRTLADGEIYFLTNREAREKAVEARFRTVGKTPEIWRADKATFEPVKHRVEGNHTIIPLKFLPNDAYFVVFRGTSKRSTGATSPAWKLHNTIDGPWTVSFQEGRGAPPSLHLNKLESLSEHPVPGVRYFSGISSYRRDFQLTRQMVRDGSLHIDLGTVGDVAEVFINGKNAGIAWKPPYIINIAHHVKVGVNKIEVRVANLWVNRLIGDAQPDADKITYTTLPTYLPDAPLRPSGLIGPVKLLSEQSNR